MMAIISLLLCACSISSGGADGQDKDKLSSFYCESFDCNFTIGEGRDLDVFGNDGKEHNNMFVWESSDNSVVVAIRGRISTSGIGEADVRIYMSEAVKQANGIEGEWEFIFHIIVSDRSSPEYDFFKQYGTHDAQTYTYSFKRSRAETNDNGVTAYVDEKVSYNYYKGETYVYFNRRQYTSDKSNYENYEGSVTFVWGDLKNGLFASSNDRNGYNPIKLKYFNEYVSLDKETQNVKLNYDKNCAIQTNSGGAFDQMNSESNVLLYFQPITEGIAYLNEILAQYEAEIKLID